MQGSMGGEARLLERTPLQEKGNTLGTEYLFLLQKVPLALLYVGLTVQFEKLDLNS